VRLGVDGVVEAGVLVYFGVSVNTGVSADIVKVKGVSIEETPFNGVSDAIVSADGVPVPINVDDNDEVGIKPRLNISVITAMSATRSILKPRIT
jgi:hypothetical protein